MEEKSTVTTKDTNLVKKMEAQRMLSRLLQYAIDPTFSGSVSVTVHASKGKLQKIVDAHQGWSGD